MTVSALNIDTMHQLDSNRCVHRSQDHHQQVTGRSDGEIEKWVLVSPKSVFHWIRKREQSMNLRRMRVAFIFTKEVAKISRCR